MGSDSVARARALVRERIEVTRDAMAASDQEIERELTVLAERGIVASCTKGCAHCCRQEILVPRAEAEAIVAWIEASWSPDQLEALRGRLRGWLAWSRGELPRLIAAGMERLEAIYEHGPQCVALEDGLCAVYPARPMSCRMHYVRSSPDACRQEHDPAFSRADRVTVLPSIHRVTQPAILRIREVTERHGGDFLAAVHRLPEWLAHLLRVEQQPWRTTPPVF